MKKFFNFLLKVLQAGKDSGLFQHKNGVQFRLLKGGDLGVIAGLITWVLQTYVPHGVFTPQGEAWVVAVSVAGLVSVWNYLTHLIRA